MAKKNNNIIIGVIVLVILAIYLKNTGFLGAAVGQGGTSEVTRSVVATAGTEELVTVYLNVNVGPDTECGLGYEDVCNDFYVVEEHIPAGISVSNIQGTGCSQEVDRIICIVLNNAVSETISYEFITPSNPQTVVFDGVFMFQGDITINTIGGSTTTIIEADACTPSWTCSEWGVCSNDIQTRTCVDGNNCNDFSGMPGTSQTCDDGIDDTSSTSTINVNVDSAPVNVYVNVTNINEGQEPSEPTSPLFYVIIIGAALIGFDYYNRKLRK